MSTTSFDNNTWYQFVNNGQGTGSGLQVGYENPAVASIFGSPFSNTNTYQSWQIINSTTTPGAVHLRSRSTGPYLYMGSGVNTTCGTDESDDCYYLTASMQQRIGPLAEWFVEPWGDGSYYLYPNSNGSSWHLALEENGSWVWLTPDVSSEDNSQSWSFGSIGAIDDATFSTISVTSSAASSTSIASTTPLPAATTKSTPSASASPNPSSSVSGGLSTGAKAGIGAGIAGAVVILAVILGLWFWRRKSKRRYQSTYAPTKQEEGYGYEQSELAETAEVVEAPENPRRFELDDTSTPAAVDQGPKRKMDRLV